MHLSPQYPTKEHEAAAESFTHFVTSHFDPDAVLLVNSCARDKATRDSCVDVVMLSKPETLQRQLPQIEKEWSDFQKTDPAIQALSKVGLFSELHADFLDGAFVPSERNEVGGPDSFEVEIGNLLAYSVPLWQSGDYYEVLRSRWLPYYTDELRQARLTAVRHYCRKDLAHIAPYVERGLYFQAFDRFYNAHREFLQALFIARRTYPIAYNKWIKEQVSEILALPRLYEHLTKLFELQRLESRELVEKAAQVEALLEQFAPAPDGGV